MAFGFGLASGFRQCGVAVVAASAVFCAASLLAQSAPAPNSAAPSHAQGQAQTPAKSKPVSRKHKKKPTPAPQVEAFQPPPPPPPPNWPANNQPQPASVGWDGRVLSVTAANSSLLQILRDISTATGVQMDGLSKDQRVFGNYGPASARDVLEKLLDGSGYNVMMIGDKGQGEPRELVLTAKDNRPAGNQPQVQTAQPQSSDEDAPEDPEPPDQPGDQPANRRPFITPPQQPGSGRTPQQIQEEMQQRQQQLQQQLQNNPQNPQPNSPAPPSQPNE